MLEAQETQPPIVPAPKETSNPFDAADKRRAQTVLVPAELRAAANPWRLADLTSLSGQAIAASHASSIVYTACREA
jgi:hypothetical protein